MFHFHFHAARPPRPTPVPANRALPRLYGHTPALPRPLPPPPPPPPPPRAAGGSILRARGEAEPARGRRQGGRDAAEVAAGGNAAAVSGGLAGDSAQVVAGLVATKERGSGGGELARKRGLPPAARPPPKRRAVSAKRQFPPGCGRDAPPLIAGNCDDGPRLGPALSSGDFTSAAMSEQPSVSPPAGTGGGGQGRLRLDAAPANAGSEKATAADGGGAPVSDGDHHGPEAAWVTSSGEAEGAAGSVVKDMGRTDGSGELGMKELVPVTLRRLPPKRRTVSAYRRFPPGCGRDVVAPLAIRGSSEVGLHLEPLPADAGLGALEEVLATNGAQGPDVCAMDAVAAVSRNVLDGIVDAQEELEEGEIPAETDHVLQESQLTDLSNDLHDLRAGTHECAVPPIVPAEPSIRHFSNEKINAEDLREMNKCEGSSPKVATIPSAQGPSRESQVKAGTHEFAVPPIVPVKPSIRHFCNENIDGNMLQRNGKSVSWAVDEDVKVMNKCEGSSPKLATKPSAEVPPKESQVKAGTHGCAVPTTLAAKPSIRHFSNENIDGNMVQRKGKSVSWAVDEDVKVMNKCEGSSPKLATKPSAEVPPKEYLRDKKVSEGCSMERASLHVAAGVQGQGIMRSKVIFTARKAVKLPVEANHKTRLVNLDRPYSTGKETESVATMRESLAPRKKLKVIGPGQNKHLSMNVTSTSALHSKGKLKDKEASPLEDDEIWKAIAGNEGKLKMYLNNPSCVPSARRHMQHGVQTADARSKVKMICRKFQFICRTLVQAVEQRSLKSSRIDLLADKIIRKLPGFTKHGPILGKVPGVEVGDEFLYRVELAIVGLHRPYQGGIDTMKDVNDTLIAISIVASGGYPDELSSSGEVIYTGSGGKPAGKKENENQKLVRGNLALKNCIKTKTAVRVIHGFKGPNREVGSHSKAKEVSTFTYDGLYHVVECWQEGLPGSRVFKYRLQRIPGQPELPMHVAKGLRKSVVRPGFCIADISQGKEKTPICVINSIDNACPTSFKYITRIKGPSLTAKRSPQGCNCTDGCSDSASCACVAKNGGEIPFNFNGAVVHAKPLIFECGPSCGCPPSCHNRVSQLGMKIPLEVFRTTKTGWGVRSLRSISAGSFICEYVGELLHGQEANKRSNDEYLFDIGQNYDIWKGMPSAIPCLDSSDTRSLTMEDEGFTVDAAEYGNIGRFINHSCSPNLYAQNVLWDHDDKRVPHIMLFAAENISPLQELTYDYNYEIDHVHDVNGRVKVKYCHCGSPQCRGRLY